MGGWGVDDREDASTSRPADRQGPTRRQFLARGAAAVAMAGLGAHALNGDAAEPAAASVVVRPRLVAATDRGRGWRAPERWAWQPFREVPVSMIDNKARLDAVGGLGIATGVGGASGNDRRFYVRRDIAPTDVEMSAEFASLGSAQCGFALRVQPDRAIVVWRNIYYSASANLILGVWEYDGSSLSSINQQRGAVRGFVHRVLHAVGDGTAVTVTTASAHRLAPLDVVLHEGAVREFGQVTVDSVPGPTTYTFPSTAVGLWESGTWRRVTLQARRRAAVRLVGTQVMFKQWLPHEPEPSWDDPDRSAVGLLPEALPSGATTPLGPGGVGLLISHLGDGGRVEVRDLRVTPLA